MNKDQANSTAGEEAGRGARAKRGARAVRGSERRPAPCTPTSLRSASPPRRLPPGVAWPPAPRSCADDPPAVTRVQCAGQGRAAVRLNPRAS